PVHQHVRKAVEFQGNRAEIEQLPGLPRVPQPNLLGGRYRADALDCVLQTERVEDTGAVRADLDPGPHFPQLGSLFVDVDIDPLAQQRQGGGQSADAATHDGDLAQTPHSRFPSAPLPQFVDHMAAPSDTNFGKQRGTTKYILLVPLSI